MYIGYIHSSTYDPCVTPVYQVYIAAHITSLCECTVESENKLNGEALFTVIGQLLRIQLNYIVLPLIEKVQPTFAPPLLY